MSSRRALVVSPLYSGSPFAALLGGRTLQDELVPLLASSGGYDVEHLSGQVTIVQLRRKLVSLFDTDGDVLFYFYGHGCIREPQTGLICTTDGVPSNEGVPMFEIAQWINGTHAREVVVILDCCHAGSLATLEDGQLREDAARMLAKPGRALFAATECHQSGRESQRYPHSVLGIFSQHILNGLRGSAADSRGNVSADSLMAFVRNEFDHWGQDPVCLSRATGLGSCVITKNVGNRRNSVALKRSTVVGMPCRPSMIFKGRESELARLRTLIIGHDRRIALSASIEGLGGIGKTELVLQLVNDAEVNEHFGLILWLDGAAPIEPQLTSLLANVQHSVVQAFLSNSPSTTTGDATPVLCVVDNASHETILSKLTHPDVTVLVTTRMLGFGGTQFWHEELDVLSREAAIDLVESLCPGITSSDGFSELVDFIDGHALALKLSAHYLYNHGNPRAYLGMLRSGRENPVNSNTASELHHRTVESCLFLTWKALEFPSSRHLWKRAALFAPTNAGRNLLFETFKNTHRKVSKSRDFRGFSFGYEESRRAEQVCDMWGKSSAEDEFDCAFSELRKYGVLTRVEGVGTDRWAMHRLVREFGHIRVTERDVELHADAVSKWIRAQADQIHKACVDKLKESTDSDELSDNVVILGSELTKWLMTDRDSSEANTALIESFRDNELSKLLQRERASIESNATLFESLSDDVRNRLLEVRERLSQSLVQETPHLINALLESARLGSGEVKDTELYEYYSSIPNIQSRSLLFSSISASISGEIDDAMSLRLLLEGLRDPKEQVRVEAIGILAKVGPLPQVIELLSELAYAPEASVHERAVTAMAQMGDECSSVLRNSLRDNACPSRLHIAKALVKQGAKETEALLPYLQDSNSLVRFEASLALCVAGDARGVDSVSATAQKWISDIASIDESADLAIASNLDEVLAASGALKSKSEYWLEHRLGSDCLDRLLEALCTAKLFYLVASFLGFETTRSRAKAAMRACASGDTDAIAESLERVKGDRAKYELTIILASRNNSVGTTALLNRLSAETLNDSLESFGAQANERTPEEWRSIIQAIAKTVSTGDEYHAVLSWVSKHKYELTNVAEVDTLILNAAGIDNTEVRKELWSLLSKRFKVPFEPKTFLGLLESIPTEKRVEFVEAITNGNEVAQADLLCYCLSASSEFEKEAYKAVKRLGNSANQALTKRFREAHDDNARSRAAVLLIGSNCTEARSFVEKNWSTFSAVTVEECFWGFVRSGTRVPKEMLTHIAASGSTWESRYKAVNIMTLSRSADNFACLISVVKRHDNNDVIVREACKALGLYGNPNAESTLNDVLKSGRDPTVIRAARSALARIPNIDEPSPKPFSD